MTTPELPQNERGSQAYERLARRLQAELAAAASRLPLNLHYALHAAKDKAVALSELTHDEADKIADYLQRDLHDAGEYLARTGQALSDWLRFDLDRVEGYLADLLGAVADPTQVELSKLQQPVPYRSDEITGPGSLYCAACGHVMHFYRSARIPPCPACHARVFERREHAAVRSVPE